MTAILSSSVLAWLLTYAVHSTVLLGLASIISHRTARPGVRDFIWKVALAGAVLTTTAQLQLGVRPGGSLSLPSGAAATAPRPTPAPRADLSEPGVESPRAELREVVSSPTAGGGAGATDDVTAPATVWTSRPSLATVIVAVWAVVALALAGAYAVRRVLLAGRLADRRIVTDGPLPAMLESLRVAAGYRGRVRLTVAQTIASPVALGTGEICVPCAALTDLDAEQQRGLLAHELAHLARRDPLWLDAAAIVERILFFQPLNRLARRELQRAAEYLSDDWATARTGSGLPLARCLERVAEWLEASPLGVPVAGMAEQRSLLVARVARLIESRPAPSPASRVALAGASIVLLGAMVAAAPGVHRAGSPAQLVIPRAERTRVPVAATEDTAVVDALVERLKDSDVDVRKAAAASLGNIRSRRAVPGLIGALSDANAEVRAAAAEALGEISDERAVAALTSHIADASPDVREHALEALSDFARRVPAAPVIAALNDSRANVRRKAAELLGQIRDESAVAPLSRLLKDPLADVRQQAAEALANIGDRAAASALLGAVSDENADVKVAALHALRELKVTITERTLLDALADGSAEVRQQAAEIAGEQPQPNAIPSLRRLLDDPVGDVREAAVDALAQLRSPAAREALTAALKSADPKVRRRATEALGERP